MKDIEGMKEKKYIVINTHTMKKIRLAKMEKLLSKKKIVKLTSTDLQI